MIWDSFGVEGCGWKRSRVEVEVECDSSSDIRISWALYGLVLVSTRGKLTLSHHAAGFQVKWPLCKKLHAFSVKPFVDIQPIEETQLFSYVSSVYCQRVCLEP